MEFTITTSFFPFPCSLQMPELTHLFLDQGSSKGRLKEVGGHPCLLRLIPYI